MCKCSSDRRQEEITAEREEIDRQKKLLLKRRPTTEGGRKRNSSASSLHNGTDSTFLKPDAVPGSFSLQEYYEADEILKVCIGSKSNLQIVISEVFFLFNEIKCILQVL